MHQTALKYDTKVSDGGRLELKTPKGTRKPVLFAAQESPDDLSGSGGGIRKRPDFGITRSMIRDWNDLSDWAGHCPDPNHIVYSLSTELIAKNS